MPSTEYRGLTHECEDADCHVGGFVTTLKTLDNELAKRGLEDLQELPGDEVPEHD